MRPVLRLLAVAVALLAVSACAGGTAVENPASQQVGPAVRSMQLLSSTQGWALTDAALKWTDDGGLTWTDITPPGIAASAIKGLFFLDTQHGWVVVSGSTDARGAEEVLSFRSSDGGKTWASSPVGTANTESLGAQAYVHFADPQHGWVVVKLVSSSNFSIGELFGTADGGATWSKLSIPIGDPIRFTNPSDGWTAGGPAGDKLYVTRDGGVSWEAQSVSPPPGFEASYPVYELPAFAAGGVGVLPVTFAGNPSGMAFYISRDGGRSWAFQTGIPSPQTLHIGVGIPSDVVDSNTWVAATRDGGRVFVTRGPGRTVQEIAPNGLPAGLVDLDFAAGQVGWALVQTGECPPGLKTGCATISQLLKTNDGGQTWTILNPQ